MNVLRTDWTFKRRKCYLRDEQSGELSWCGVIMATHNACKRNNKIPKTPESRPSAPWFLRLLQSKIPLHRGPHSTRMTGPNLRRLEFYSVGVYVVKKSKFVASDTRWFWCWNLPRVDFDGGSIYCKNPRKTLTEQLLRGRDVWSSPKKWILNPYLADFAKVWMDFAKNGMGSKAHFGPQGVELEGSNQCQ